VDWEQVKSFQDILKLPHRDANIAAVMEKEVLAKHRKALMLFGTFHLMHGVQHSAVSLYEKDYPNLTFVITDLTTFAGGRADSSGNPFASWQVPSLARIRGTWLGAMDLARFLPAPTLIDMQCQVHREFPKELRGPMEDLVDAVLYLGPPALGLKEQMPAAIALDFDYRKELARRASLPGIPAQPPQTLEQENQEIVQGDADPLFLSAMPKAPDPDHPDPGLQRAVQNSLDNRKNQASPSQ
jgi:hypothetical protein